MKQIVLSLFDYTGVMVEPWLESGYECWMSGAAKVATVSAAGIR